ncbi:DUF3108 domain-containing protein [Curvibacter sp. APW13]|uniref:DUF3108 domain-containing protein n=1 Tax=Curvibacter sp. APW13 TaxID=3077236 RepID=UPI0028DE66AA|nr:DUF3108 domain-containing protein [Curvibacter sp. APW13]MDT8990815.1 DUF3108 domain-containing protein [Curvibacter sp. APW13]
MSAAATIRHRRPVRWRQAGSVLAIVILGHWAVLSAATLQSGMPAAMTNTGMVFETRWVPVEPRAPAGDRIAKQNRPQPASASHKPSTPSATVPDSAIAPRTAPMEETQLLAAARTEETAESPKAGIAAQPATSASPRTPTLPPSVRLLYDIKGETKHIPVSAQGELLWRQDGKTYDARMEIRIFLLGSRVQTSKGLIGAQGLEPVRFGDKVRSEVAAHFERGKGKVTYSANTPDEPLQAGAQDQLSIFFQLAGLLAAGQERYPPGSTLSFQAVGPRSSETWTFKVLPAETIALPGGQVRALRLTKDPLGDYDSRAEVWLAPELDYLPVRIRLTQSNGDMVDQLWRATERPPATP